MITAWIRLDRRPPGVSLGRWDSVAEPPAEVLERYAQEKGPPLLLWATGDFAGGLQGERRLTWPRADFAAGAVSSRKGKGHGVLLVARAREAGARSIVVLRSVGFDQRVLDWMVDNRAKFAPLFSESVVVEPTDEEFS